MYTRDVISESLPADRYTPFIHISSAETSPVSAVFGCVPIDKTGMQLNCLTVICQIQGGENRERPNCGVLKISKNWSLTRDNIHNIERETEKSEYGKNIPENSKNS